MNKEKNINVSRVFNIRLYTANSKKVVLRKSKIQITKYKIQEKALSHHTHEWTFNFQSVIYTLYEEVFSVKGSISR